MNNSDKYLARWITYLDNLTWQHGHLDESSYYAALRAATLGVDSDYVFKVLCVLIENAGQPVKEEKVRSQIARAFDFVANANNEARKHGYAPMERAPTTPRVKIKATFEPGTLQQVASNVEVADIHDFVLRKSMRTPAYVRSCDFLNTLYRQDEKVMVFTNYKSQGDLLWEPAVSLPEELPAGGPDGVWYLINPVDGERYPNPRHDGQLSGRSQESATSFRYLLLESDAAPAEEWLKLLVQLPLPIESICESGGRSIHAILRVNAASKDEWDSIVRPAKPYFTRLGADPGALSAVRLSRLPQAFRGDRQQRLLYLNSAATDTPIMDLAYRPLWHDWLDWAELVHRANLSARREDMRDCLQNLDQAPTSLRVSMAMHFIRIRGCEL